MKATEPRDFHTLSDGIERVNMMYMKDKFNTAYIQEMDADVVNLPYKVTPGGGLTKGGIWAN